MEDREYDNRGLTLITKGRQGLFRVVFSRTGLIVLLLIVQVVFLFGMLKWLEQSSPYVYLTMVIVAVVVALYLFNSNLDPTSKLTWMTVLALVPIFGALFLLYTRLDVGHRAIKGTLTREIKQTKHAIPQDLIVRKELSELSPETLSLATYVGRSGCHPIYNQTEVTYFPTGEDKFDALLVQLEQARHFIFLEYFIINEGLMWGRILEILARKAKEGVDIRVMYDGTCEFSTLPRDYPVLLKDLGIACKVFSPATPFLSTHYNYRDHRKILVIDGHTAFTGGVNLADEYINHVEKYGHWKDVSIMLQGEAVRTFTLLFLQTWNMTERVSEYDRFLAYPSYSYKNAKGYVLPYGDHPLDQDKVGERVYMDILNRAQNYVHIMSPYLILDGEMEATIKFAAERGVEVSLILPGIPDKKVPYALAKTHYSSLLDSGVKIYEYIPGFIHAKVFVSDDRKAVVGTINLDYRSLYHHFECAAYLYDTACISDIEADFQETLLHCKRITRETIREEKFSVKATGFIMKALAPLM